MKIPMKANYSKLYSLSKMCLKWRTTNTDFHHTYMNTIQPKVKKLTYTKVNQKYIIKPISRKR